jgi:hypothetical protein
MLRRSGFKKPTIERKPIVYTPIPEHLRKRVSTGPAELKAMPKAVVPQNKTADDRRHMDAVAQLGCIVCRRLKIFSPLVELHHPRRGAGMGQRAAHKDVLPLCYEHHRGNTGVHGLGTKGFEKHYGFSEADLLADVAEALAMSSGAPISQATRIP